MKTLTKHEYSLASTALINLCGNENPDPFSNPFLPRIKSKMIISGGIPKDVILNAIKAITIEYGDTGFYMHCPEPHLYPDKYEYDWYVSFDDIETFRPTTLADHMEYVYYSPQGIWGIVTSDIHGVIGGPPNFCEQIVDLVPGIENDVVDFVKYWKRVNTENPTAINLDWLQPMLVNIYSDSMAKLLLQSGTIS